MPEPVIACAQRADFTEEERAAWKAATEAGMIRLGKAVQALPKAIPLRTSGSVACPNCGGVLAYARWQGGAEIRCTTSRCVAAHFNIARGAEWPTP